MTAAREPASGLFGISLVASCWLLVYALAGYLYVSPVGYLYICRLLATCVCISLAASAGD